MHNSIQLNQAHDAVKLFNQIDKNGDGKISKDELFNGLQPYKKDISDEQLRKQVDIIFNNIDSDHNGYLEYEEFVRAAIDKDHFFRLIFYNLLLIILIKIMMVKSLWKKLKINFF